MPLPASHIRIVDLPQEYRRKEAEVRFIDTYRSSMALRDTSTDIGDSVLAGTPIRQKHALDDDYITQRVWQSADGRAEAALVYDGPGTSLLIQRDGRGSWSRR